MMIVMLGLMMNCSVSTLWLIMNGDQRIWKIYYFNIRFLKWLENILGRLKLVDNILTEIKTGRKYFNRLKWLFVFNVEKCGK